MANDHIEKPNMLATKNTARWMVLFTSAGNEKQRCRMKYHSLNQKQKYFSKAMESGKSPVRSIKDLHGYPNCTVDCDEWTQ